MKMTGQLLFHKTIGIGILILLAMSSVSAFGVSSSYWGGHPLYVSPGEIKEIELDLQNQDSDTGDAIASVAQTSGSEIAQLKEEGKLYDMPYGTAKTPVYIEITIPQDAEPGQTWTLTFDVVSSADQKNPGVIQFNTGMKVSFDVVVQSNEENTTTTQEAPESTSDNTKWIIGAVLIGIVIIAIILMYASQKRNEKPSKGKRKRKAY